MLHTSSSLAPRTKPDHGRIMRKTERKRKKKNMKNVHLYHEAKYSWSVWMDGVYCAYWLHDANHLSYSRSNKNSINLLTPAVINLLGVSCLLWKRGTDKMWTGESTTPKNPRPHCTSRRRETERKYIVCVCINIKNRLQNSSIQCNDITWRDHLMVFCFHTFCSLSLFDSRIVRSSISFSSFRSWAFHFGIFSVHLAKSSLNRRAFCPIYRLYPFKTRKNRQNHHVKRTHFFWSCLPVATF